jgi:hypothetical protein
MSLCSSIDRPKRWLATLFAATAMLGGCSTVDVERRTVEHTDAVRQGPQQAPRRTITSFAPALRCMDGLLADYGVRDVSMLVEDLADQTQKVNAGARDMLISAVSDMTRRSRAIRLVAFGKDASNAIGFLASAQRQGAYAVIPQYDIKGSISQLDEDLIRNQKDVGIGFQPLLNLGVSRDAASTVLGLDLSVLTTQDMSVLPGVTSRNSVVILKQGRGLDGDAAYHKFGISYSMNLSRSEGRAQALRGLIELAVIELAGKLTKTPYWRCLEADASRNEEVRLEVSDWYYAMATSRVELIAYFQNQLRRRGYYDGPVDGTFNPAIDEAIAGYRFALGLSREAVLDEPFFIAYLGADHRKIARPAVPARWAAATAAPAAPMAAPAAAAAPAATSAALVLELSTNPSRTSFALGEPIGLRLKTSRDAYVYCYVLDEHAKLIRFFPNRYARDPRVAASSALALPGAMRFQLAMTKPGAQETFACFATERDVLADLPATVVGTDFEPLAATTLSQVREAFVAASRGKLAQETLHVRAH